MLRVVWKCTAECPRHRGKGFCLFHQNQRQWSAAAYTVQNIDLFQSRCKELGFSPDHILTAR